MPTEFVTRPIACELLRVVLGVRESADRDLLSRFVKSRDEEAFAEIVRRHGRMVLAVGRRVTGHPQDAEDAFQAAFLVLARRAGHLKRPDQLANWLYGVAYRTALEARALRRRRAWEQAVPAASEPRAPEPPDDGGELRRIIDEELSRIPDKYRTAIVMCDLEGLPRTEAAVRLSIPEGTLSSRLAYGRKLLAAHLTRRGITFSASALAVALAREAVASTVPRKLLLLTARSAARAAPGVAVSSDLVSPSVSSITDGVMKAMLAYRLRLLIGTVLCFGLVGLGTVGFAQLPGQAQQGQPPADNFATPVPTDPFTGNYIGQQPRGEKAEKVAAKGIEDDDVPLPATPSQAVVRLEDGKLIVRQRSYGYHHIAQEVEGQRVQAYQMRSTVAARTFDPSDVSVFDMKGNRLQNKAWRDKFKTDVHALVAFDGRLPNPRELALFKDDALLVVLPAGAPGAATWGIPSIPAPAAELPTIPRRPVFDSPSTAPARPGTPRAPRPENENPISPN